MTVATLVSSRITYIAILVNVQRRWSHSDQHG